MRVRAKVEAHDLREILAQIFGFVGLDPYAGDQETCPSRILSLADRRRAERGLPESGLPDGVSVSEINVGSFQAA